MTIIEAIKSGKRFRRSAHNLNYPERWFYYPGKSQVIITHDSKSAYSGEQYQVFKEDILAACQARTDDIGLWESKHIGGIHRIVQCQRNRGRHFKRTLEKMSKWDCFSKLRMKDVFNEILKDSPVSVKFIRGSWLDINSIMDLQKSESFIYD